MNNFTESIIQKDNDFSLTLINDFSYVWENLNQCTERGISVFNDFNEMWEYISYADMYKKAGRLAGVLKKFNISAGTRVMLCSETTPFFSSLWLALVWIGAVPVPVPPKDCLTGDNSFQNHIKNILPYFSFYICNDNEKGDINSFHINENNSLTLISFSELKEEENVFYGTIPDHYAVQSNDIAYIQYTSRTTRTPKGILITYKNLFASIYGIWKRLEVNPKTLKAASWLPLYHDTGLVGYFLSCVITQTELFLLSPLSFVKQPFKFLSLISLNSIEIVTMPNFALDLILKRHNITKNYNINLHTLRWLGVGSEPVKVDTIKRVEKLLSTFGLKQGVISPCYCIAEATLGVSMSSPYTGYELNSIDGRDYVSSGQNLDNIEIKIKKKRNKQYGSILIKGDAVAMYALVDGEKTMLLDKEGYYNTLDIGMQIGDTIILMGREDDMFVFNGESFFCQEIEDIITECRSHGQLRAVCFPTVMKKSNGISAELIIMYDIKRLIHTCKEEFEEEMRKQIIRNTGIRMLRMIHVPRMRIPLTPSGKVMRHEMRDIYISQVMPVT